MLLGPLFIPFFLIDGTELVVLGLGAIVCPVDFYPVVGDAYMYVFGKLLIKFVDTTGATLRWGEDSRLIWAACVSF